ncbi:putative disease resistance protein At1g50180, partial [Fagus crenata]
LVSPSDKRRKEILNMLDDELAKELHQVQQNRKCLVVLDDIWTIQAWRDLHAAIPITEDAQSKIMLTSRNRDVALHVAPQGFLHVPTCLNEERSWELLKKVAISWREGTSSI